MLLPLLMNLGGMLGGPPTQGLEGKKGKQPRRYFNLPDGTIVVATIDEALAVIRQLEEEYAAQQSDVAVPQIVREATQEAKIKHPADFPARKPVIQELRATKAKRIEVDFERALRGYLEGAQRRKDDEEWLLLMH